MVHRNFNIAVIVVRALALISVAMGAMWGLNIVVATVLSAIGTPEWLMGPIWNYTIAGLLAGPIWLITGLVVLRYSERLAAYIVKVTKNDAA